MNMSTESNLMKIIWQIARDSHPGEPADPEGLAVGPDQQRKIKSVD
jgi:hypothetical protein